MAERFEVLPTSLPGLTLLQRRPLADRRGFLERLFCTEELAPILAGRSIMQITHTHTAVRGVVRGLHFQHPPAAEMKFVHCLRGEVCDVAVDLRRQSPTLLRWHAERLTQDNHRTLVIPEGFAHGFQTLTEHCEMLYFHTAPHRSDAEAGIHPADPRLAIDWPLPVRGLSPRDQAHPPLPVDYPGLAP